MWKLGSIAKWFGWRSANTIVSCFFALYGFGQLQGTPFVDSYSKTIYGYGTQNWDIEQADNGTLYFANNEGLLEFDGSQWDLYPLPNRTVLRSLSLKDGFIYAGGQNEFGRFEPHPQSKWQFHSLINLIPEPHRDFEDVWNMQLLDDELYFRASEKIFIVRDHQCTVITEIPIHFLGKGGEKIFVQHRDGPLYYLEQDKPVPVAGSELLAGTEVRSILSFPMGLLIATRKQGLFLLQEDKITKWQNEGEHYYPDQFINTLGKLPNQDIVLGTGFRGIVVLDSSGQYKYQVDTEDGLSNNRVICTFVDRQQNLWLGLDNGISMVRTNSPFSRIYPDGDLEGAGYEVAVLDDKIYFGTSSGLFYTQWGLPTFSDDFQLVENTSGQVWGLDVIDDRLLLSHNDGAFIVEDGQARPFYRETGVWLFIPDLLNDQLVVSGNYKGITLFDRASLQEQYTIPGLEESSRFIVQDEGGSYWMSHPYRGIYRISDPTDPAKRRVRLMGPAQGLPSHLHNHVFKINGEILVCAEKGVFTFDVVQQTFVHYEPIEQFLGRDIKVRRLFEGKNGDVWFITETEIGLLEIEDSGLEKNITKRVFPELKRLMNGGWERIYAYDKQHVFISTINGFLHYQGKQSNDNLPPFQILINKVRINEDSVLYVNRLPELMELNYRQNSLLFNVAATEYVNNAGLRFQYFLEGFDENWSQPTALRSKEYPQLAPGSYTLFVKGINLQGETSAVSSFHFEIKKPWYTTYPILIIYALIVGMMIFGIFRRSRKRFQALEQKVDSTVKKSKEEIQRLETEKIQAELEHKKRELVSATLHLMKKNETMVDIADQISEIKKKSKDPKVNQQLQKLVHSLKQEEFMDEGWEQVMYHFSELNEGYFDRLKKAFPSLTPKDLKLCAYLKMNLTTKEMATLMNVSLRGVEASRYRLRKKLALESEENLTEFLMGF